jgi:hypothetical protein
MWLVQMCSEKKIDILREDGEKSLLLQTATFWRWRRLPGTHGLEYILGAAIGSLCNHLRKVRLLAKKTCDHAIRASTSRSKTLPQSLM